MEFLTCTAQWSTKYHGRITFFNKIITKTVFQLFNSVAHWSHRDPWSLSVCIRWVCMLSPCPPHKCVREMNAWPPMIPRIAHWVLKNVLQAFAFIGPWIQVLRREDVMCLWHDPHFWPPVTAQPVPVLWGRVCAAFLLVLQFTPTAQRHAGEVNRKLLRVKMWLSAKSSQF